MRNVVKIEFFLFFIQKFKGTAMQFKKLQRYDCLSIKTETQKFCVAFKNESFAV